MIPTWLLVLLAVPLLLLIAIAASIILMVRGFRRIGPVLVQLPDPHPTDSMISDHDRWCSMHGLSWLGLFASPGPEEKRRSSLHVWQDADRGRVFAVLTDPRETSVIFTTVFDEAAGHRLETCSLRFLPPMPPPPRSYQQAFPGSTRDELLTRHLASEELIRRHEGFPAAQPLIQPYAERARDGLRRQVDHFTARPLWPLHATLASLRPTRLLNRPVEEQIAQAGDRRPSFSRSRLVVALLLACCVVAWVAKPWRLRAPHASGQPGLRYIEKTVGGGEADEPLPLLVAMHGLGGTPEMFARKVSRLAVPARVVLPAGPYGWPLGTAWLRSSDRRGSARISAARLAALIEHVQTTRPTVGRAVVAGFSQGGMVAFQLATDHPELVGTALPMAAGLPGEPSDEPLAAGVRVRAFHGAADPVVPYEWAAWSVAYLRDHGADAELATFPAARHASKGMVARWNVAIAEALAAEARR